jgi:hypothetical protein
VLPPSWRASVDISLSYIYDEDREKRDDVRSILRMNTTDLNWFMHSREVIALCPVFAVLRYEIQYP